MHRHDPNVQQALHQDGAQIVDVRHHAMDESKRTKELSIPLQQRQELSCVFSSHFFTKLREVPLSRFDDAYAGVQRWSRGAQLFKSRLVFVPVAENLHWSLAVLCNLSALSDILKASAAKNTATDADQHTSEQEDPAALPSGVSDEVSHEQLSTDTAADTALHDHEAALDAAEPAPALDATATDTATGAATTDADGVAVSAPMATADAVSSAPCIIFLDSLSLHQAKRVGDYLRAYVQEEWARIHPGVVPAQKITKAMLPLVQPAAPTQSNGCDCGVFVLQYAEELYMQWPSIKQSDIPSRLSQHITPDWFDDDVITKKRAQLRGLLNHHKGIYETRVAADKHNKNKRKVDNQ